VSRVSALLVAALTLSVLAPAVALADPVQEAGERVAQKAAEQAAASCRRDPVGRQECAAALGTADAGEAAIAEYEASELSRTLALQRTLGDGLPLQAGLWVGTHNSANSTSEDPTLSQSDSNQQLSLSDQLRLDVRSLELDAHWFPSLRSAGQAPVLCHAQSRHEGCTTERLLEDGLAEIAGWLDANPGEVVLLYLEDHLDGQQGHDKAVADLRSAFGTRLFTPAAGTPGCTQLPLTLTRDAMRAAGAQVVVMTGGCNDAVGQGWLDTTFSETQRKEDRPVGYGGYPRCGGVDLTGEDSVFRRYFEDSTFLNSAATLGGQASPDDGLTPETVAAMTRCGVDLLGLDQLVPADGRLEALAWSFAPGQLDAAAGSCAAQRVSDGRWEATPCKGERLPAACQLPDGAWTVSGAGPRVSAEGRCEELGAVFAVPRRGRDAQLLLEAQQAAGADAVWLALKSAGNGRWA